MKAAEAKARRPFSFAGGMLSMESTLWHPVCAGDDLVAAPLAVRLLERDLVLWRDASGQARAFKDQCPHRGARLSLGRVQGGLLECPYHGWRFEGSGRCVAVPAVPGFVPPTGHRVGCFDVAEAAGLVWVRLEASEAALTVIDGEDDPRLRKLTVGPYDVATSAPRIVENFLDLSHFGFVHEGWLGDREHVAQAPYQVSESPAGLVATGCRAWQPQSNRLAQQGSEVEYTYTVPGPYRAVLTKLPQAQSGYRDVIHLFVCPVEPERSRVWFRLAVTDFDSSDEDLRAFQHTIFTQDQPVLESQRPRRLPLTGGELHSAADRLSTAYRRYLRQQGITFGVC
jgi:phenylpropionate dioxygenase-like ring-hydroxylating dioxygenase large terminal subunit